MSPVLLVKELPLRGSPAKKSPDNVDPEVRPYLEQLERSLALELSHRGSAQPARPSPDAGTITCGMRDGSAHVLRCLKVWYDLPSDVFFGAVSFIDRFLAKMKVRSSVDYPSFCTVQ